MALLATPGQSCLARPPNVLVVDDDVRSIDVCVRAAREAGATVRVSQASDSALGLARVEAPDVLICALEIGAHPVGLALARQLRHRCGTAVVFVSSVLPTRLVSAVAAFKPDGFLCKPLHVEQVSATLRLTLRKGAAAGVTTPSTTRGDVNLVRTLRQIAALVDGTGLLAVEAAPARMAEHPLSVLRPREQEIVRLLFNHCRVPTIAERLGISPQTVRNHLKHIFRRLGVHSQQELIDRLRPEGTTTHRPPSSTDPALGTLTA